MPTVAEILVQAWQRHQAGDLSHAEQLYRQILEGAPSDAQVWYLLGTACQMQGKLGEATSSAGSMKPWPAFAKRCKSIRNIPTR